MEESKYFSVEMIKELRMKVDYLIQSMQSEQEQGSKTEIVKDWELYSMSAYQVIVKLIEAKMWMGKMLEAKGNPFPPEFADKFVQGSTGWSLRSIVSVLYNPVFAPLPPPLADRFTLLPSGE